MIYDTLVYLTQQCRIYDQNVLDLYSVARKLAEYWKRGEEMTRGKVAQMNHEGKGRGIQYSGRRGAESHHLTPSASFQLLQGVRQSLSDLFKIPKL
jgi:hypothetical protein